MRIDYYTADWCKPCQSYKPVVKSLSEEMGFKLNFIDVDRDDTMINIFSVPTLAVYKGDVYIKSIVGAYPESKLREELASV